MESAEVFFCLEWIVLVNGELGLLLYRPWVLPVNCTNLGRLRGKE